MHLSAADWQDRAKSADFESELATALATSGYFVLERLISAEKVSELLAAFTRLFEEYVATSEANRGEQRHSMHLPMERPFADPEIFANPLVFPLLARLLGDSLECSWFGTDTPLPGSDYQDPHADLQTMFPQLPLALPVYALVVNIPLVDVGMDNGPMEIWPGTHLNSSVSPVDGARVLEPKQVLMPAGSFLVRDPRLWHRGTPNRSTEPRPNLALMYQRPLQHAELLPICQTAYDGLSEDGQRLFRLAPRSLVTALD